MDANELQGLKARWNRFERAVVILRDTEYPREARGAISDHTVQFLEALYPLWEYWCRLDPTRKRMPDQDNAVRGTRQAETVAALVNARGGIPHDLVEFVDRTGGYGTARYGVGPYGVSYWAWRSYSNPNQVYKARTLGMRSGSPDSRSQRSPLPPMTGFEINLRCRSPSDP